MSSYLHTARERERAGQEKAGRVSLVHLAPTRRPTDRPTVALIIMQHVSRRAILVLFSLVNIECAASLIMRPSVNAMVARRHGNVRIAAAAAEPEPEAPAQPVLRRSRPIGVLGPKVLTKVFTYRVCAILLGTLGGFTAAFAWLENWHWLDALYYVLTTAATVGFGDFRPSNLAGRVLTVALSLVGTGLVGGLLAGLLGEWSATVEKQQQQLGDEEDEDKDEADGTRLQWRRALKQGGALLVVGVAGFKSLELRGPLAPSWADALYLVIGTLTTSGIGDVVPRSRGARTFIAVYSLIGTLAFARLVGALALRPLEKARREAQLAVLSRYTGRAGRLTQQTLEELARGALVKQLALSADDAYCSRDEFTLLTLVEMGKITEADLVQCRSAFEALDVDKSGYLSANDLAIVERQRRAKARAYKAVRRRERWSRIVEAWVDRSRPTESGRQQDE